MSDHGKSGGKELKSGGRFSARRKTEAVLRLRRGENLETLSRELGVTAAKLSEWREAFVSGGQSSLKTRTLKSGEAADVRDEQIKNLQAKVGEQTMAIELLNAKIDQMEIGVPFGGRRLRR